MSHSAHNVKALGLLSGGLDSVLASQIVMQQEINVTGITFILPWKCHAKPAAVINARSLDIPVITHQLKNGFLDMIEHPQHGYGTAMNPCIDCKIFMLRKAEEYRKKIKAHFLFTGEVLGQRPMSQTAPNLRLIERRTGLAGKIVRPLSARLLPPTEAEHKGWINREALLAISGRSRKLQEELADRYHIHEYSQPAGGCHLTEASFASRLRDFYRHAHTDYTETESLMYGRHYRINNHFKAVLGRDEGENTRLEQFAKARDHLFVVADKDKVGPLCRLQGPAPNQNILTICGGLIKRYSKYKHHDMLAIHGWQKGDPSRQWDFNVPTLSDARIREMRI
jgi:tRNA U34 2-thiouridine synthase MnmA/TrmU